MRPSRNSTAARTLSPATHYLPFCHHSRRVSPKTSFSIPVFPSTKYPSLQNPKSPSFTHQNPANSPDFGSLIKASMASSAPSTGAATETKPFSVLFVCLGNICRSPAAEGVFRDIVKKKGLDSKFSIDSAGTIAYHEGNLADPRMRAASKRRGIEITSISRPIRPSDFRDFDLILAMDKQNRVDILEAFNKWKFRETLPADAHKKVRLMCSYCKKHDETEVPDPYYGGPQGFEKVFQKMATTRDMEIVEENDKGVTCPSPMGSSSENTDVHAHSMPSNNSPSLAPPTSTSTKPPSGKKSRKRTSEVWEHFEHVTVNGEDKAICNYCKFSFKANSKNGTKSLLNHMVTCSNKRNSTIESCFQKQKMISVEQNNDGKVHFGNFTFDQEVSRNELARAIILHEYPISVVDHVGFRRFVASLQLLFKMVSRNTIKEDILNIYQLEKSKLMGVFKKLKSRITITTDMWTSN